MKKCSKCKEEKELCLFNKNKRKADGYSTECKECVNTYNKQYRKQPKNKAVAIEYNKIYQIDNRSKIAIQRKEYAKEHKIESALRAHNWYLENIELSKERTKTAKKTNPIQYNNYAEIRRARKLNAIVEKFTDADIIALYGNKCFYCNGNFEHIDHYVPLSKGGDHTLKNIRPSCQKCNLSKNNKLPEEWLEFLRRKSVQGDKI